MKTKLTNSVSFSESIVFDHFDRNFQFFDYHEWNSEVASSSAHDIIQTFDSTKPINLDILIISLWEK